MDKVLLLGFIVGLLVLAGLMAIYALSGFVLMFGWNFFVPMFWPAAPHLSWWVGVGVAWGLGILQTIFGSSK